MNKTVNLILKIGSIFLVLAGITCLVLAGMEQIKQVSLGGKRPAEYDDFADVD